MRHLLLILSMLASLVVCPFDCMGRMADGQGALMAGGKCCCCSHCNTNSDEPCEPNSDGQRCECICNGAVLTDSISIAFDQSVTWGIGAAHVAIPLELTPSAARHENDDAVGRMRPGRSRHLALHSLQV